MKENKSTVLNITKDWIQVNYDLESLPVYQEMKKRRISEKKAQRILKKLA